MKSRPIKKGGCKMSQEMSLCDGCGFYKAISYPSKGGEVVGRACKNIETRPDILDFFFNSTLAAGEDDDFYEPITRPGYR